MRFFSYLSALIICIVLPAAAVAADMIRVPVEELSTGTGGPCETPPPFFIDTSEVTNAEFAAFLADFTPATEENWLAWINGEDPNFKIDIASESFDVDEGFETHPVVTVTLEGAKRYAEWAGKTIPTDAQWEAAAKLGGTLPLEAPDETPAENNGEEETDASPVDPAELGPVPVESLPPDDLGLYGMLGNVWEWTIDEYETDYLSFMPRLGLSPAAGPTLAIARGGGFLLGPDGFTEYPAAAVSPNARFGNLGFRCVREVD